MTGNVDRRIPEKLAPLIARFELEQPTLVSREDVERIARETGVNSRTSYLIEHLVRHGWLIPLSTRGLWEFAPAARAGPFSSGNNHIELYATLRKRPDLAVAIAAESAAWLHGLSGRKPAREVIAASPGLVLPPALKDYRVVRHAAATELDRLRDLPVWSVDTLLAAMAIRPNWYRDWRNVSDWLAEATNRVSESRLRDELETAPRSAWARLAYLLARGDNEHLATAVFEDAPPGRGPFYLGRRDRSGTYDAEYDVIDSALIQQAP